MASVDSLIGDRKTFHVEADQLVLDVVKLMVEHNIGAVAVLRNGELAGLFTERDLMKRVVHESMDPQDDAGGGGHDARPGDGVAGAQPGGLPGTDARARLPSPAGVPGKTVARR